MTSLHDYSISLAQIVLNKKIKKHSENFWDENEMIGLTNTQITKLYEKIRTGVPKWAKRDFIRSKTDMTPKITEKSIFSDKDGNWGTLPLEVLQLIMTHHSRNNNRYWGSISFARIKRSICRDYNPYKNVAIYQPSTYYEWRWGGSIPRDAIPSEIQRLRIEFKKMKDTPRTEYGIMRDYKISVIRAVRDFRDVLGDKDSDYKSRICLTPSKLKYKYVKNAITENCGCSKFVADIANDGVCVADYNKGWRVVLYRIHKGYFIAKYGKRISEQSAILIMRKKMTKTELREYEYKPERPLKDHLYRWRKEVHYKLF